MAQRRSTRRLAVIVFLASFLLSCPGADVFQALGREFASPKPPAMAAAALRAGDLAPLRPPTRPLLPPPAAGQADFQIARPAGLDAPAPENPAALALGIAADFSPEFASSRATPARAKDNAGRIFEGSGKRGASVPDSAAGADTPATSACAPLAKPELKAPSSRGKEPPSPSNHKPGSRRWILHVAVISAALLALDWGSQILAVHAGWPNAFHELGPARQFLSKLAVGATAALAAHNLRSAHKRAGAGDLAEKYPAARRALALTDAAWAALIAGVAGNGLGVVLKGGGVDFIPFGDMGLKPADIWIFSVGFPLMSMAAAFIEAARAAHDGRKPLSLKTARLYALPVLGLMLGHILPLFGRGAGDFSVTSTIASYALLYSTLFAAGLWICHLIFERLAQAFNKNLSNGN